MAHDTAHTAGIDWSDPHAFHHDAQGHHDEHDSQHPHVISWQKLVLVLFALLFFTALTVFAANAEAWASGMGIHITHFWNVVIAVSIAVVKATLVCMFFMHLKYDTPLNTMILLTTLFVFGLFLMFTSIDLGKRGLVNPAKAEIIQPGGNGIGMGRGGGNLGANITTARKKQTIEQRAAGIAAAHGRDKPTDEDLAEANKEFWSEFYHHKVEDHHGQIPPRHPDDTENVHADWLAHHMKDLAAHRISDASHSRPRHGLTPGLFDAEAPKDENTHGGAHGEDSHGHADQPQEAGHEPAGADGEH